MSRKLLFAVLVILFAIPSFAQVDKAAVEAVALDQAKAPLPGVTVTVRRPETGFEAVDVTDAAGVARFKALAPGKYSVSFALEGFAPVKDQALTLLVGQTAKFAVTLQPSASETITVSAGVPIVDVHKTDSSTNIVPEQIESLPVADRDFQRLAFITPGVQRERGGFRFINGGPVVGAGGNASQTTIVVDGVDFTDQVNGLSRARFSQDAVQRVPRDRQPLRHARSAARPAARSRSSPSRGRTTTHGTVFGFFRDAALREKGALDLKKNDDYSRHQLGFTLGGPIDAGQAFLLRLGRADRREEHRPLPSGRRLHASQAADVSHPFEDTLLYGGLDSNINSKMTAGFKAVYEDYSEDNFRVGGVADASYGQTLERKNWNGTFEHNTAVSNSTSNEARVQFGHRRFSEPTNTRTRTGGVVLLRQHAADRNEHPRRSARRRKHVRAARHAPPQRRRRHARRTISKPASPRSTCTSACASTPTRTACSSISPTRRALPLAYAYGVGSSDVATDTNLYGAFLEDAWRPNANLLVNLGVRYDLDTNGNNPGFTHPLDSDAAQEGQEQHPAARLVHLRRQGRRHERPPRRRRPVHRPLSCSSRRSASCSRTASPAASPTRASTARCSASPSLALDPAHPTTTGIVSKPAIALLSPTYKAPSRRRHRSATP